MQQVNLPDGTLLNFPDGMSQDDMRAAIISNFPKFAPEVDRGPATEGDPLRKVTETSKSANQTFAATALPPAESVLAAQMQDVAPMPDVITSARAWQGAAAGRGSPNDPRRLDIQKPVSTGSVFDRLNMDPPQVDAALNEQAMLKSVSPDSVMFEAGRGKQRADGIIADVRQADREKAVTKRKAAQVDNMTMQPVYDPETGALIGESMQPGPEPDYGDHRSAGDFGRDVGVATLKIGPTALKTVAQIYAMGTGGLVGKETSQLMDESTGIINEMFGSKASDGERKELASLLHNPDADATDLAKFLVTKPMLMADMGISNVGSMFVPAGAAIGISKILGIPLSAAAATAVANTSNAVMNAADTFEQTNGDFGNKAFAASIAGLGSYAIGRVTEGGAEGLLARQMAGAKSAAPIRSALTNALLKEPGQEFVENVSQQVGQDLGEGKAPDVNSAVKQGVLGAMIAPIAAGPVSVREAMQGNEQKPLLDAQALAKSKGFLVPAAKPTDILQATSVDEAIQTAQAALAEPTPIPEAAPAAGIVQDAQTVDQAIGAAQSELASPQAQAVDNIGAILGAQTAVQPEAQAEPAAPVAGVEPVQTWFGRRGDGYQSQEDAGQALPGRQKAQPEFDWKIEQMPNGRFRLAGYALENADASPVVPIPGVVADASGLGNSQPGVGMASGLGIDSTAASQGLDAASSANPVDSVPARMDAAGAQPDAVAPSIIQDAGKQHPAPAVDTSLSNAEQLDNDGRKLNDGLKDNGKILTPGYYSEGYPWQTGWKQESGTSISIDGRDILAGFDKYRGEGMRLRDAIRHAEIAGDPVPQEAIDRLATLQKQPDPRLTPVSQRNVSPEAQSIDTSAAPVEKAAEIEQVAPKADGVKIPERIRYYVTKSPAYDGIEPLSVEDADFELEALENSAKKGRLTPGAFAQSEIGKRIDGASIIALQSSLKADPVGTIQALRSHIENKSEPAQVEAPKSAPVDSRLVPVSQRQAEVPAAQRVTTDWKGQPWDGASSYGDPVDSKVLPGDIGTGSKKNTPWASRGPAVGHIFRNRSSDTQDVVQVGKDAFVVRPKANAELAMPEVDQRLVPVSQRQQPSELPDAIQDNPRRMVGQNYEPIDSGAKPFKFRKDAKDAQKQQPHYKVVALEKGFGLIEKTPGEIAAQEQAAKRLARANAGEAGKPESAHAFIISKGGLNQSAMADTGFDRNVRIGNRFLFAGKDKGGLTLAQAAELLHEAGYIGDETETTAANAIKRSATVAPLYTPEGIERMAEAEAQARFDDHLNAEQEAALADDFDPFQSAEDLGYEMDDAVSAGYDEASDPIKLEVNALLAQAEAAGIDTETLREDAARETLNQSEQAYYERTKLKLQQAIAQGARSSGDAENRGTGSEGRQASEQGSSADRGEDVGGEGDAGNQNASDGRGIQSPGAAIAPAPAPKLEAGQAELDEANALRYKTPNLARLLADGLSPTDGFEMHLLANSMKIARAYNQMMTAHNGDFSGIEYSHPVDTRYPNIPTKYAFVLPDASQPGKWRISYFDKNGFSRHESEKTLEAAQISLVTEGYSIEDKGALDRLASTKEWARGTALADLIMRLNRGDITHAQFIEYQNKLNEDDGNAREGLTSPTPEQVTAQQERAANADELDQREQINREADRQTLTQPVAPEQRRDNTGDIFGGPTVEDVQRARELEQQKAAEKSKDTGPDLFASEDGATYVDKPFVESPRASYTGNYETDLFGEPVPQASGANRAGKPDGSGLRGNVQQSSGLQDTPKPQGEFNVNTVVGSETTRRLGSDLILSPLDAAQATHYLYKSAVERFDGIVTDKNGNPLGVVGGFKGATDQTSVYPGTLIGEAVRIPGAAYIWFSHNHPSGNSTLSRADESLNRTLSDVFKGSGIEPQGLIAVGGSEYSYVDQNGDVHTPGKIPVPTNSVDVPVIERAQQVEKPSDVISDPTAAIGVARTYFKRSGNGILLLDAQNSISAWIPLGPEMLKPLRGTGALNSLYRAISQANASASILVHDGDLNERLANRGLSIAENIGNALARANVRVLDAINVSAARPSAAEGGMSLGSASSPMFSRGQGNANDTGRLGDDDAQTPENSTRSAGIQGGKGSNDRGAITTSDVPLNQSGEAGRYAGGNRGALNGIAYSKGEGRSSGLTLDQFQSGMAEAFGQKVADSLIEKGVVVPLEDQSKLPDHVVPFLRSGDIVYGFNDPKTDRTYAVLSNLTPGMIKPLALHEVGVHYGFEAMLGDKKYAAVMRRLDVMEKAGQKDVVAAAKSAKENSVNPRQIPEERLAYLVQNNPEMGIVREIIAAIKAFLFREFGIGEKYLTSDDLTALAKAAVMHASRTQDGGSFVPAFAREPSIDRAPVWKSALLEGVNNINAKALTGAMWKDGLKGLVNKGLVKQDEIAWSGLDDWLTMQQGKVPKEAVLQYLQDNGVKVTETMLGDAAFDATFAEEGDDGRWYVYGERANGDDVYDTAAEANSKADEYNADIPRGPTKYSQYTLPGGQNYREVLLTLPTKAGRWDVRFAEGKWRPWNNDTQEWGKRPDGKLMTGYDTEAEGRTAISVMGGGDSNNYRSGHWDQPNVLAHIRFNERTDADGKRVLFIEEIQSDWGQAGKKQGFDTKADKAKRAELQAEHNRLQEEAFDLQRGKNYGDLTIEESGRLGKIRGRILQINDEMPTRGTPEAPFVTKTDAWVSLAMKRMIRYAVDNGFDKIAFVNGAQSAERYDLSKSVDEIKWGANGNTGKTVYIQLSDAGTATLLVNSDGKVVGSRGAGNAMSNAEGKQLDDVIGKDIANQIMSEKEGALAGDGLDIGGEGMRAFYDKIVPTVAKDVLKKLGGGKLERSFSTGESQAKDIGDFLASVGAATGENNVVHHNLAFDITPAMREKASQGLPMFSKKRGTNDDMANRKDVVGNQGGRSADDTATGARIVNPAWPEHERFATAWEDAGFKVEVTGSAHSDSRYVKISDPVSGADIEVRIADHQQSGRAMALHNIPDFDVGDFDKANAPDLKSVVPMVVDKINKERAAFKDDPLSDGFADSLAGRLATNDPPAPTSGGAFSRKTDQTNTSEFRNWFGDWDHPKAFTSKYPEGLTPVSYAVDKDGKPLVLYHATNADFSTFDVGRKTINSTTFGDVETERHAIFATPDVQFAEEYFGSKSGANVMPVYMSIHSPIDLREDISGSVIADIIDNSNGKIQRRDFYHMTPSQMWQLFDGEFGRNFVFAARKAGYDGAILKEENTARTGQHDVYAAFEPTQIKSAIGNNGAFDPTNPDIRFSRQIDTDEVPAPTENSPWRDPAGRLQFAPGQWLYDKIGDKAGPLLDKLGLKAASPELRHILRRMKLDVAKAQETATAVAHEAMKLSDEEREMVSDLIEKELKAGTVPPEHAIRLAAIINSTMETQTNELVRLEMLSKESADRWRGQYLPRFYESKMTEQAKDLWADAMRGMRSRPEAMKGIKGKHLKGRGMYETIPESQLKDYETMGWEVRDPDYTPSMFDGTVQVWRDFTRQERDAMGEIRDSGFRFVMGYMQTQKDIALGKMFESLAQDPDLSSRLATEKFLVQVPATKIAGTEAKMYGKLAGRWVSPETLSQLTAIEESHNDVLQMYRKAMGLWKEGKTVLNPVSHANNIISNISMAHFAGVSMHRVDKYIGAMRDFAKKSDRILEAKEAGLFLGTLSEAELMNTLPDELKLLAQRQESGGEKAAQTAMNLMSFYLRKPMGWAYQAEDTFFRYLIYKDAREQGMEPADAVDHAQNYIFTYDDLPKGARRIRDYGIPFFAYTYKAIPALLHTALTHPLRMAAPAAVLWAANAAAYAIGAGDDDDKWYDSLQRYIKDPAFRSKAKEKEKLERELLPQWMKGHTALGTQKTVRLGTDELTKLPLFMDMSRMVPGGDLFDVSPNAGGLPIPQPFTPSHPIFTTLVGMLANKDLYFGKELVDANDTRGEATQKRLAWLWKQMSPAIAINNYHWERGMNALARARGGEVKWIPDAIGGDQTGIGRDGLPVQPKYAVPQTFGIKIRPIDLDLSEKIDSSQRQKMLRDIDAEMNRMRRLVQKGAVAERTYEKAKEEAGIKKERIKDGLTVDGDSRD